MLTGGLGNQLFQLAFGISASLNGVELEIVAGQPRVSARSQPDLLDFELPEKVLGVKRIESKFVSRVLGYNLRLGIIPKGIEKNPFFVRIIRLISSLILSYATRRFVSINFPTGVGFDNKLRTDKNGRFFVGYFQTYKWLQNASQKENLRKLTVKNPSREYMKLVEEIEQEETLIIHVRLGDYLDEPAFGTPSLEYYLKSLDELSKSLGSIRIWGFSDDPKRAREIFDSKLSNQIRWIHPASLSSSETLDLMRYGSGYVIANSTFSWWAATLRHNQAAPVFAPNPWFKGMPEPLDLIPIDWKRMNAYPDI